jgi:phosphatidylethanolamine-binding protein (PEBP) family uncharacterized protein
MESGRGAERLLSPRLRRASARAILVLAAVTLILSGCGDSSDDETASTASQGEQAETGAPASEPATSGPNPVPGPGPQASAGHGKPSSQGEQGPQGQGQPSPEVAVPSGEREKGITPQQRAEATKQSMSLESPTLRPPPGGGPAMLTAAHTCDGEDTWPELAWRGVPAGTAELALFAMGLRPVEGQLSHSWTVAGIDPDLTGIPSGRLPKGAVMGRNSFGEVGYTVCPPKGSSETYIVTLYALPERLAVRSGFDPNALRREVGQLSSNGGIMAVGYRRG